MPLAFEKLGAFVKSGFKIDAFVICCERFSKQLNILYINK